MGSTDAICNGAIGVRDDSEVGGATLLVEFLRRRARETKTRIGPHASSAAWSDHKKKLNDEKNLKICKSKIYVWPILKLRRTDFFTR